MSAFSQHAGGQNASWSFFDIMWYFPKAKIIRTTKELSCIVPRRAAST